MQKKSAKEKEKNISAVVKYSFESSEILTDSIFNTSSFVENSQMIKQVEGLRNKKRDNDNRLKKMLQDKPFEKVMRAKMRSETASAFGMFWRQGNEQKKMNNEQLFVEKENLSLFCDKKRRRVDDECCLL